jgi:LacI family transcriptional regulator
LKVTLQQVAEYAKVSRRTVDRVVNNRGNVRPEVEQRVRQALKELNYQPNKLASALAYSKNEKKVCIIYQKEGFTDFDAGADTERGIRDAIEELKDFGISVEVICKNMKEASEYVEEIEKMVEKGVCGFALRGPNKPELVEKIDELAKKEIPVVTFNSDIPKSKRVSFIGQDLYQSGRAAGNIMAKIVRPEDKIVIGCGVAKYDAHQQRVNGFVYELKRLGFDEEQWIMFQSGTLNNITYDFQYRKAYQSLENIFQSEKEIHGIYMSVEPNRAVGDFLRNTRPSPKPYVICHDSTAENIEALKTEIFDFIIDQNLYMQGYQSLITLKDIIRLGYGKIEENYLSNLIIYNAACFE